MDDSEGFEPAPKRYRQSAGILLFRGQPGGVDVLLGHPGGPFWEHKDEGAWTIFKGEFDASSEQPFAAATREFAEETGFDALLVRRSGDSVTHGGDGRDEAGDGESSIQATSQRRPLDAFIDLGTARQRSGKLVYAYALDGDLDAGAIRSNLFDLEWPPRSGRIERHPEIDRAAWYALDDARTKIMRGQVVFLDRLIAALAR